MAAARPAPPLERAGALDLAQVRFEAVHAAHQTAPVDLELGLTGAPRPDATGLLAERAAPSSQAGQSVPQQRQLHLGLALGAAGVLSEDVEDHRRAIDGRAPEELLQVPVLRRGQLVVEDDRVDVEAPAQLGDLLRLAAPDERGGVGCVASLHHAPHDVGTGAVDEQGELVELVVHHLVGEPREDDADEEDALPEGALDERPGQEAAQESIPGWISMSATLRTGPAR